MSNIFGTVSTPDQLIPFGTVEGGAIGQFLNILIKTLIAVGGVYALFNLILAGYAFLSAGDDSKKVAGAWAKIWQTALGLAVIAGAFVLAAIFGLIIYNDPTYILSPAIPTL